MNRIAAFFIAAGIFVAAFALRNVKIKYIVLTAFSGISALFAVDIILGLFQLNMPINVLTLSCAAIGGLPGVILITVMNGLFGQ